MTEPTTEARFHITDGAWDAMNAALSRTFPIYEDPEAGTDIDGDVVAVMDALRDYNEGYVVVPLAEARASLDVERLVRALDLCGIGLVDGHPASLWADALAAAYRETGI